MPKFPGTKWRSYEMENCLKTVLLPEIIAALLPYGFYFLIDPGITQYALVAMLPGLYLILLNEIIPHQRFILFGLGESAGIDLPPYWILGTGVFLMLNVLIIIQLSHICKYVRHDKMIPVISAIAFICSIILIHSIHHQ